MLEIYQKSKKIKGIKQPTGTLRAFEKITVHW